MSNLARPTSHRAPFVTSVPCSVAESELLDALRSARRGSAPLQSLDSETYARDHAAFEARSNQRELIATTLAQRLSARGPGPISVLSVGCGDGTLDVRLARHLLNTGEKDRSVRYVGVDPYESGTSRFASAMAALEDPALSAETSATTWAEAEVAGPFDVITFVHSMYYVPDVAAAIRKAHALLRPGGELVVLSGPRGAMNTLVDLCAPPVQGHRQWFSDDVALGIETARHQVSLEVEPVQTLEALLNLYPATAEVLDFTVQAQLDADSSLLVRDYLEAASVPDPVSGDPRVPHPVDVHRAVRSR